jgi:hypothetical protein
MVAFGVAVCVLAPLAVLAAPAREGHACSLVGFGQQVLPFAVESSSTIAVGRLVKAERDVITLEVEEGLKGTTAEERLTVNNATLGLGADCSVSLQPNGRGFALPEGARVLAFLQANELGGRAGLRSALYGYGVFKLDGEFVRDERFPRASFVTVRDAIQNLNREPVDLNFEAAGPCNPSLDLTDGAVLLRSVRMSPVVAVGSYRSVGGGIAEFDVQQVLRGDTGGSKTLRINAHYFHQSGSCRANMEAGSYSFPVTFRALVFLRPDDYGVTDWRGAVWGLGVVAIVGDELQGAPGLPTLDQVRAAVRAGGAAPSSPTARPGVGAPGSKDDGSPGTRPTARTPGSTDEGRDDLWLSIAIVVGLGTCAVAAASYVLVRRRRR